MALRKGTIYYILTTLQIVCCQGSFYINTEQSKWTDASSKCTPATPVIDFDKKSRHLSINDLQWQDTESAWTGYFKATMAFEYTGCAKLSDISKFITSEQDIDKDPSQCFPRCEMTDTIGVTEEKCYCLQRPLPKSSTGHEACTNACKEIACGGKKGEYVSIYTINPRVITEPESSGSEDTDVSKSCLSMENRSGKWETCAKHLTQICRTKMITEPESSGSEDTDVSKSCLSMGNRSGKWETCAKHLTQICRTKTDETTTGPYICPWLCAANKCFSNQHYPAGYSDALSISNLVSTVWTGVFKMEIIFSRHWKGHDKVEVKEYGFTQKDKNKYTLDFTDVDGNRKILCDSVEDKGSGAAAGICVAVVLITAAIVATAVYLRKRYINSRHFDKMSESSESRPDHESQPNSPVGTTPTEQSVRNNVEDAEYNYPDFSIQNAENTSHYVEISETGNSVVDSSIKLNPYSYESAYKVRSNTSDEDIPYNKLCGTNKVNPKTQGLGGSKIDNYDKLSGNSYDVLGTRPTFETGSTYATTSEQESATKTYDTCLPSSEKLKQSQGGFTDNIYAVNSDTYNILGNETKQSKTDQLYGMKQVEKFKDILKLGGNESIYNTTSGKSETNTVTDNPYAKLGH